MRVLAAIDDGVKPTMRVGLSDGSAQQVTTNHPFYVDSGQSIAAPQWVQAGDLRVGDRIRTASEQDVTVAALVYNTGSAHVYTLTVANDHDFFVGPARVLVHNATINCGGGALLADEALKFGAIYLGGFGHYREIAPGVFRANTANLDGTFRQFRITLNDITDPKLGPHVRFEEVAADGRRIIENAHIMLLGN